MRGSRSSRTWPGSGTPTLTYARRPHKSYSACCLGSPGTDELVRLVRAAGPGAGLYGAKINGGGSGGTVAVLGRREARASVEAVTSEYVRRTAREPLVISGSSPGAGVFGHLKLMMNDE